MKGAPNMSLFGQSPHPVITAQEFAEMTLECYRKRIELLGYRLKEVSPGFHLIIGQNGQPSGYVVKSPSGRLTTDFDPEFRGNIF